MSTKASYKINPKPSTHVISLNFYKFFQIHLNFQKYAKINLEDKKDEYGKIQKSDELHSDQ